MNNNTWQESDALYIGVLSGTSLDAVDVALVDFKATPRLLTTHSEPMPEALKHACLALSTTGHCQLEAFGSLDQQLGHLFSKAVLALLQKEKLPQTAIQAIGSHGQTIWHQPKGPHPFTMQIGDPNLIAELTGITTVADFRRRDMAAGGQGAPLACGLHQALFHTDKQRFIINIGGIANLTVLTPGADTLGFDSGPGNGLMDQCAQLYWGQTYDKNGALATQGKVHQVLLDALLSHPYIRMVAPKSTGREVFHWAWVESEIKQLNLNIDPIDIMATLLAFTVETIALHIEQYHKPNSEIYLCGGGAHNETLVIKLQDRLGCHVFTTKVLGMPPDWVEAILFAWLARQTIHGIPGQLPSVTGASHPVVLGSIYPGESFRQVLIDRERTATPTSGHCIGIADHKTSAV